MFARKRALIAVAPVSVWLLAANLWGTFEPGEFDSSPFAEPWVSCDTIAYGWPLGAARWAAVRPLEQPCPPTATCAPSPCEYLPDFDPISFVIDGVVASFLLALTALFFGKLRHPFARSRTKGSA